MVCHAFILCDAEFFMVMADHLIFEGGGGVLIGQFIQ